MNETKDDLKREKVRIVPISNIEDFPDHPFQVKDDESMDALVESIRMNGVLNPVIALKIDENHYQLISGHRRKHACVLLGIDRIPLIGREMTKEEAVIEMVDSNLQREHILPSEKARAYKMKMDAMKKQGERRDLTSNPVGGKLKGIETAEIIGDEAGESANQVRRYIRLNELTDELLEFVDEGKIVMRPAVISVDIFSDEYMDKINAIQLPNTKIKILQRLLSQAIDEFRKINKIMGVEFSERLKRVVDEYNNRRRDEAYANEVLDDVAEKLAALLEELKKEKDSFKDMGIDYEEKAFYDILNAVARKYEFEYPDDKMIELSKRIKAIVDDKSRYTDWSTREDIKANLQVDLILLLDEFDYPPVTIDDVYKEVLEQAENFKKYM